LVSIGQGADQHAGADGYAFRFQLLYPAVDVRLLHLEVRNAVAQQAANAVVLFEQGHARGPRRASCCAASHAGRPAAHHGHLLAGFVVGRLWRDPAFVPGAVDDGVLDRS